ncbi:hypothetical protein TVAG_213600 [Trichomonas vaginalis G3]|uniref:Glycoprotein n=1 Tax=Trichomonas vaginalis (strain ATCC PRA-98 / G3) TaxID=412133 RepID=A2EYU2_TRIV3|nr:hypothetical protein TVAGG3_0254360 [Trichomonas vaginalis G3]EAY02161.1 hypothetical protein TVAG_213600 [Trichomonas vaginalis G3]KAI5554258.1 hypothetical protein TVAGG3_0254360 [Trichomonas vaginalis G3]|eukprot:XP_001330564.1 hypothetical protein [Trichomonas vaginalis G3]
MLKMIFVLTGITSSMVLNPSGVNKLNKRIGLSNDKNISSNTDIATCKQAFPFGVEITFDYEGKTLTRWAKNISGQYICGSGDSWFQYTSKSNEKHSEGDPLGGFLVFIISVIICIAFTGTWPILASLSLSIDVVKKKLDTFASTLMNMLQRSSVQQTMNIFNAVYLTVSEDQAETFGQKVSQMAMNAAEEMDNTFLEEREKMDKELVESGVNSDKHRKMTLFSRIYMIISFVLMFFVSLAVAQLFCAYMKWPNLIKKVETLKCYQLNTEDIPLGFDYDPNMETNIYAQVGNTTTNSTHKSHKKILEDNSAKSQYSNLNTASFSITEDKAVITSDCEASWVNLDDKSKYVVLPSTKVVCKKVDAVKIALRRARTREKCGDSFAYKMHDKEPAPTDVTYKWTKTGKTPNACKRALSKCDIVWEDTLGFKKESQNWLYCNVYPQKSEMLKVDSDGTVLSKVSNEDFEPILTVDPMVSREYGWYTDGTNEIIVETTFNKGIGSNVLFEDRARLSNEEMVKMLEMNHYFSSSNAGWSANEYLPGPNVKPNSFQCRMQYTLKNIQKYKQVSNPCQEVHAQLVDGTKTRFTTTSETTCSLSIGFGNDEDEQIVTLKKEKSATFLGPTKWRCKSSSNGNGTMCSTDTSIKLINIDAENVNGSIQVDVTNSGFQPPAQVGADLGFDLGFGSLFNGIQFGHIAIYIIIAIIIIIILVILKKKKVFHKLCKKIEKSSSSLSSLRRGNTRRKPEQPDVEMYSE